MTVKKEHEDHNLPHSASQRAPQKKARADAVKRYTDIRHAFAWPLHRVPLEKHFASEYITKGKTKLVLPRSYRSSDGEDRIVVGPQDDLNHVVYCWFSELAGDRERVNFVTQDGIVARRHEYIGPDPRVAGYHVGIDGDIHIRWWDAFLQDPWSGNEKWEVEVACDAQGEWSEISQ